VAKRTTRSKDKHGPQSSRTAAAITGEHVYEQGKATRAKAALEALRRDEPPLGSLTSEEQSWLTTAFANLNRIYEKRGAGKPGNNAVCICEIGNVYVQFLAPWDAEQLVCEAASTKSVPEIAAILPTEADEALRKLGFAAPEMPFLEGLKASNLGNFTEGARARGET
jgi:hypothetical protein